MKRYHDNSLKNQILAAVHTLQEKATSKNIREFIDYKGSDSSFKSEIYALKRRGYLSFAPESKNQKVKRYILTKKGNFHRLYPDHYRMLKQEKIAANVREILNSDEKFTEAIDTEVDCRMEIIEKNVEQIISGSSTDFNETTSIAEMTVANIIAKKDTEIKNWKSRYFNIINSQNTDTKNNQFLKQPQKQSQPEKKTDDERIDNRKKLATYYFNQNLLLNFQFFNTWKNMVPVLLSGRKFLNRRSVEIMSVDEAKRELERGHTRAILENDRDILACCFQISKINKDGIVVVSDRLDLKKNMKW